MFFYKIGIMQFVLNFLMKVKSTLNWTNEFTFKIIELLQPLFSKNVYFLRDTDSEYTELIDAYSLFEYMLKNNYKCFYIINKFHPQYEQIKSKYPKNIIPLDKKTKMENLHIRHFFKFLHLKNYFSAWGLEINNVSLHNFLYNNKHIEYVFLQHGIILLKSFMFDLYNKNWFNKMLVSNDYEKELVKKHMGYDEDQLIKACLPRFENLFETNKNKEIFVFFTWRLSFDKIPYETSKYYERICSLLNNQRLNKLLQKNNITLNVSLHHKLLDKNNTFNFSENINQNIHFIDSTKVSDYIKKSDMLITDYSSIWADFLFQNKPAIFYRLDFDDENLIDQDKNDLVFSKNSDDILFNVSYDEDKTIDLIEKYIVNSFTLEAENIKKTEKLFYVKKDICKKILEEMNIE